MAEEVIEIYGGRPLSGRVKVAGAKNAALPLIIASLLTAERVELTNIPGLHDVGVLCHLLESFGTQINRDEDRISLCTPSLISLEAGYSLVKALRASFWVLAPLLARGKSAKVALPGGDIIGTRAVDLHLQGLSAMGADISMQHGSVIAKAPHGLRPAEIALRFPSVGATHQILMAAALIDGTSTIRGVAREPEVVALCEMLQQMGAVIEGIGSDVLRVTGREKLGGVSQKVVGDRIEAGTYMLAALSTQGKVEITGFNPEDLRAFIEVLTSHGALIDEVTEGVIIKPSPALRPMHIKTEPFPGFPTDLQAPFCSFLASISGESSIEETIYDGRVGHVTELLRMGVDIRVEGRTIFIRGGRPLSGAEVEGVDIRGAAALAVAAFQCEGPTIIHGPGHIRRGYERFEEKVRALGVKVLNRAADQDDFAFAGC